MINFYIVRICAWLPFGAFPEEAHGMLLEMCRLELVYLEKHRQGLPHFLKPMQAVIDFSMKQGEPVLREQDFYTEIPAAIIGSGIKGCASGDEVEVELRLLGGTNRDDVRKAAEICLGMVASKGGYGYADESVVDPRFLRSPGMVAVEMEKDTGYSYSSRDSSQGWQLDSNLIPDED